MELFGVGPLEFLLILVLALVIMGPEDMVGTARKLGQWIYKVVRSPTWRAILSTTQDLRDLPQKIVRDAGIEEAMKEVKDTANQVKGELKDATEDINKEMKAATSDLTNELNVAAVGIEKANSEAKLAADLAKTGSENASSPAAESATLPGAENAPAGEPAATPPAPVDPYARGLDTIAAGLDGKSVPEPEPATSPVNLDAVQPQEITQTMLDAAALATGTQIETAPTEMISMPVLILPVEAPAPTALVEETGGTAQVPETAASESEMVPPAEASAPPAGVEAAHQGSSTQPAETAELAPEMPAWASGVPAGLEDADAFTNRIQSRMDEMSKQFEKLDKISAGDPPAEPPTPVEGESN
jgi:sec-independent protein translocase protein TatB